MDGISLDSVLGDEVVQAPQVTEAEPIEKTEADKPAQPRAPDGKFAPKGEDGASPAPVENDEPAFDHAAVKGERARRQAAEAEREELRRELEALKQQPKEPAAPPPTIWEDDQAWQQHLQQQIMQQTDQVSRINASEMAARSQHPDFQEMFDLFNTMAVENPSVVQQAMADPHPWNKAYQIAKNHRAIKELGAVDLTDLEAKLRDQIKAEMAAAAPAPQAIVPTSLADAQSARGASAPGAGPLTLEEILGH